MTENSFNRKGIILAGGSGTRLHPLTKGISKQLAAIYDKPMIYYPLSTLMLTGIRDILIISTPYDLPQYKKLLGSGNQWGLQFSYCLQENPEGLAQAFHIGENFLQGSSVAFILGDNFFYGNQIKCKLLSAAQKVNGATIFAYPVSDPQEYGVVEFGSNKKVISIEEKPKKPKSNYAVPGLYFYDKTVVQKAKTLVPSQRGEYEITDLNNLYLNDDSLFVENLGRGTAWLDTGTHDALLNAANYVAAIQNRQNMIIASPEEIAFRNKWITKKEFIQLIKSLEKSKYGQTLKGVLLDI